MAYTPPEALDAAKRANGQKLTLIGAVLAGAGVIGILLSMVLHVVWLGILGQPIAALSWVALLVGVVCFISGFNMIKSAHRIAGKL